MLRRFALATLLCAVAVPAWGVTFEEAEQILTNRVLAGDVEGLRVFGLPQIQKQGTQIRSWTGESPPAPAASWFFFVDDLPLANWEHACRYVFIEEKTATAHIYPMTQPPRNRENMVEITDPTPFEPGVNYNDVSKKIDTLLKPLDEKRLLSSAVTTGTRRALLISGGADRWNNHIRYWGDIAFVYRSLVSRYGWNKSDIVVCMSDGNDPAVDRSDGSSSPTDLDGDGNPDYSLDSTKSTVESQLQALVDNSGPDDLVFIFTTDHGGQESGTDTHLYLWNSDTLRDDELADILDDVTAGAVVVVMEQCFSGGFVDDLEGIPNLTITTACRHDESSYAGETYPYFDEFAYEWISAVNGATDDIYHAPVPVDADTNANGLVAVSEAFAWAVAHDDAEEEPQMSDLSLLADTTSLWWSPLCSDGDTDGYGYPASLLCTYPEEDCDDSNSAVNPGATEGPFGSPTCSDSLDNDCDGFTDELDPECVYCLDAAACDDANPCTDDDCVEGVCTHADNTAACDDGDACTMDDVCSQGQCTGDPLDGDGDGSVASSCGGDDCDDSDPDVHPGAREKIGDGKDNNCDGRTCGTLVSGGKGQCSLGLCQHGLTSDPAVARCHHTQEAHAPGLKRRRCHDDCATRFLFVLILIVILILLSLSIFRIRVRLRGPSVWVNSHSEYSNVVLPFFW